MTRLAADRDQIARFVDGIFRYADGETYVSLRCFFTSRDGTEMPSFVRFKPKRKKFTCRRADDAELVNVATKIATWLANDAERHVFCPPLCTFDNDQHARREDLACGLALSVECDQRPGAARMVMESLLGPATIVVASGGRWTDPDTGEEQDKLHLHWRLTEPTLDSRDHDKLRAARDIATEIVGADTSGTPMVHPMRWPGSWHRKDPADPRLAVIVAQTDNEIELDDATEILRDALGRGRTSTVDDFGDDAGRGMEGISRDELPAGRGEEHWQRLAKGVDKGTTGRIGAVISVFGHMLKLGMAPELAITLARAYNSNCCRPPLDDKKVDDALDSILRREFGE